MRFRIFAGALVLAAGLLAVALPHARAQGDQSCGEATFSKDGVVYRVLFAKNGAVQQYVLAQSTHNVEQDHDALKDLEAKYGPAGANAPAVRIVGFRSGSGGLMIPDKAVDSCGRVELLPLKPSSNSRARVKIASNIGTVSFPVLVFCLLG